MVKGVAFGRPLLQFRAYLAPGSRSAQRSRGIRGTPQPMPATVKKITGRSTVMCEVGGTKLALGKELAQLIRVLPLASAGGGR